jgi:hypothetical protein
MGFTLLLYKCRTNCRMERQPHAGVAEFLMEVELELSNLSDIVLTVRRLSVEPDPTKRLRLTSVFQRMVSFSLLILI